MRNSSPIILMTDFGHLDPYVGVMKGVIASTTPSSLLIDLTHHIKPQGVGQGAFVLQKNFNFFPKNSVFLCVVDPGVGSSRKAIAIRTQNYFFVGPDNGLMERAASEDGILWIRELTNTRCWRTPKPSKTFHGRDIFAPVAAQLSVKNFAASKLGPEVEKINSISLPQPSISKSSVTGEVVLIDQFGNAITNIVQENLPKSAKVKSINLGKRKMRGLSSTYSNHARGLGAIINSNGCLEIVYPNGSAEKYARIRVGANVKVVF